VPGLAEPVSGTKAELAKRIKARDDKVIVFDDIMATFKAMVARDGLGACRDHAPHQGRSVRRAQPSGPRLRGRR
jgi:hypothetical protein